MAMQVGTTPVNNGLNRTKGVCPGAKIARQTHEERILFVERLIVRYPGYDAVHDILDVCRDSHGVMAEPYCAFIGGEAGYGKSTAAAAYANIHREGVLLMTLPSPANPVSIAIAIFEALEDPLRTRGSLAHMTPRVIGLLKASGKQLVIFDEFHHLLDSNTDHVLRNASEWVKLVIVKAKIAVAGFGRPEAEAVLRYNKQLGRRFCRRKFLDRFRWSTADSIQGVRTFLAAVDRELPLLESSNLSDYDLAARLYYASDGNVDYIMKIVRGATTLAILQEAPRLDLTVLSRAFRDRVQDSIGRNKMDPFAVIEFNHELAFKADKQAEDERDPLAISRQPRPKASGRPLKAAHVFMR